MRSCRAAAAVAGLLVLGGCGSGAEKHVAPPSPRFSAALAGELAQASDAVAAALDSGDGCSALTAAHALQQRTQAAIAAHRVAPRLRRPLQATVDDLVGRIQCVPPVEAGNQAPNDQGRGKDKGKHKGDKKHGGGGD